jgi:hypothetical protein
MPNMRMHMQVPSELTRVIMVMIDTQLVILKETGTTFSVQNNGAERVKETYQREMNSGEVEKKGRWHCSHCSCPLERIQVIG